MSWYSEYRNEWKEIIETVAAETKKTPQMVEKDTLQTMFLSKLSKEKIPFVFKGGTALSKVYGLINRFSEDIDLSANRKLTQSERKLTKTIITGIAKSLDMELGNPDEVFSNHDYNKYVFLYDSLFNDFPLEIIVETSYYLTAFPCEKKKVHGFVADFCEGRGITLPVPFDAADCEISVQSLERTFVDKIFAICDYRIQDMQERDSRHLYDIAKLLTRIELNDSLKPLIVEVRNDRLKQKNNPSAQPQYDISEMLREMIASRFYESDYRNLTMKLLYEEMTYDEAIEKGIRQVEKLNIF